MMVIKGFVFSYRGSKELFNLLKPKIIEFKDRMTTSELANIVKSCDIAEFDDKELYRILEIAIV
jgi:hypothetical protein